MATQEPRIPLFPARVPPERITQNENTCPHGTPACPVCIATDELLRIVHAEKPAFGFFGRVMMR